MTATIHSVLAFLVVLGVLVFFHELGHYLAARSRGVVVEAFSIGFGPALLAWRAKSGTVWKISALPLGGYVKMQGWGDDAASDEPARPGSFGTASLISKAIIVAAGPIANFILAFVVFAGLFLFIGRTEVQAVISKLAPNEPAAAAGLLPGDRIIAVNGHKVQYFEDIQQFVVDRPGAVITVEYLRGQTMHDVQIAVGSTSEDGQQIGRLGIEGDEVSVQHFGPLGAVVAAGEETASLMGRILSGLWNLIVHQQGLSDLGGTIRIAQLSGQVASLGAATFVNFIAMLSVNLGLVNLLPIPILDGGHLLFYAGEAIYGRPIPRRALDIGMRFGFAIIISLFTFTTINDLTRIGALNWVAHLFG
jgi:regulator of sigma E protease